MFKKATTSLKRSGVLNKLMGHYLDRNNTLAPFYSHFPDLQGFRDLLMQKPYQDFDHAALSAILKTQAESVSNSSENTFAGIEKLRNKTTYTLTTGHQLCLFTGPLYFIYKIYSTINLASALKKEFPEFDFIPVYWMAS